MSRACRPGHARFGPWKLLEYRMIGPRPDAAPTLVMLHEGLGCVGMWGDFPDKLAAATGCGVFVYSRAGYGKSSPVTLPRPISFMHDGSAREPAARARRDRISARPAGRSQRWRVDRRDLCRQPSGSSGARTGADGAAFHLRGRDREIDRGGARCLRQRRPARAACRSIIRMSTTRSAAGPMSGSITIFGNGILSEELAYIRVPILIVQGEDDQYGTMRQIEIAQEECYCPVDVALLPGVKHNPASRGAGGDAAHGVGLRQPHSAAGIERSASAA